MPDVSTASRPAIFESGDYGVQVVHDQSDPAQPIGVCTADDDAADWLDSAEARELARAILTALDGDAAGNVTLASSVSFNEGLLRLAAVHGKTVTFRYAKGGGDIIEQRSLIPTDVRQVGDHLTFTGYDPDRDEPRAYRVDRMLGEVSVA